MNIDDIAYAVVFDENSSGTGLRDQCISSPHKEGIVKRRLLQCSKLLSPNSIKGIGNFADVLQLGAEPCNLLNVRAFCFMNSGGVGILPKLTPAEIYLV